MLGKRVMAKIDAEVLLIEAHAWVPNITACRC